MSVAFGYQAGQIPSHRPELQHRSCRATIVSFLLCFLYPRRMDPGRSTPSSLSNEQRGDLSPFQCYAALPNLNGYHHLSAKALPVSNPQESHTSIRFKAESSSVPIGDEHSHVQAYPETINQDTIQKTLKLRNTYWGLASLLEQPILMLLFYIQANANGTREQRIGF